MPTVTAEQIAAYDRAEREYNALSQRLDYLRGRLWELRQEMESIQNEIPIASSDLDAAWHAMIAANGDEEPTYSAGRSMTE